MFESEIFFFYWCEVASGHTPLYFLDNYREILFKCLLANCIQRIMNIVYRKDKSIANFFFLGGGELDQQTLLNDEVSRAPLPVRSWWGWPQGSDIWTSQLQQDRTERLQGRHLWQIRHYADSCGTGSDAQTHRQLQLGCHSIIKLQQFFI